MRASIAAWFTLVSIAGVGRAAPLIYAYDLTHNHLISFRADAPGALLSDVALTGLSGSEYLLGIDVRPLTGELFGVASDGRLAHLVSIDVTTGAVTGIGVGDVAPAGDFAGIDFNPTVDRLRVVSDGDTNERWNPNTGAIVQLDADLVYDLGDSGAGMDPHVVHIAYLDHGASPTTLYGVDSSRDMLVRIGSVNGAPFSPNLGLLFTVGALGVDTSDLGGFDIEPQTDAAYALLRVGATQSLMAINLSTAGATLVGATDGARLIDGIAIAPEPDAIAAAGAALAALGAIGRKRG